MSTYSILQQILRSNSTKPLFTVTCNSQRIKNLFADEAEEYQKQLRTGNSVAIIITRQNQYEYEF